MPCLTIAENKVHHCTQGKRTWKVWFPFRSLTLSFSLLIWNKPFFLSLGTTMYCWRNWPDCYYREISWSKWEAVFYSAGHEGGKIFVHINVHECTGKIYFLLTRKKYLSWRMYSVVSYLYISWYSLCVVVQFSIFFFHVFVSWKRNLLEFVTS